MPRPCGSTATATGVTKLALSAGLPSPSRPPAIVSIVMALPLRSVLVVSNEPPLVERTPLLALLLISEFLARMATPSAITCAWPRMLAPPFCTLTKLRTELAAELREKKSAPKLEPLEVLSKMMYCELPKTAPGTCVTPA